MQPEVSLGATYRRFDDPHAAAGEHMVEHGRELAVAGDDPMNPPFLKHL